MSERVLKVFLCHSSGDKRAVQDLYSHLRRAAGYIAPWLDKEDLLPGQRWEDVISAQVRNCDIVLVCLSKSSIQKTGYVQKEIKYALDVADMQPEGEIFLIPVKLEECQIPHRLSHLHFVNLFERWGFDRLMRSLALRAQKLGIDITRGSTYSSEERREIIKRIIARVLEMDESEINLEATLADLGGDYIDGIEIRNKLEDEYGIEISEEDAKGFQIMIDILESEPPGW